MNKIILIVLLTILMGALQPASPGFAENFRVMLHTGDFPPYFFEKDDPRTGIIKDIFSAFAKETGDTYEYVRVPFKRALYQFDNGKIDIEPMSNPVWRKSASVPGVYSLPLAVSEEILLFNADSYRPVKSPKDLLGKTIGGVMGYQYPVYGPYFEDGRINLHLLHDENKLIQLLLAGRLDQALMNKVYAQYLIKSQLLGDRLIINEEPCSVLDMMVRFHPSKRHAVPRYNRAIEKFLKDGTIERIYENYR